MESIFGRKKPKNDRPRQVSSSSTDLNERSVPYDKLGAGRAPIPISAPITNPTLTADGTEFNIHHANKTRAERERAYAQARQAKSQAQPRASSPSTSESSTLYDNVPTTPKPTPRRTAPSTRTARSSNPAYGDKARSPMMADFGGAMGSPTLSAYRDSVDRPLSATTSRSDSKRESRYTPSTTSSDVHARHLSNHFHLRSNQDNFEFPRPPNEQDIESLFELVVERRQLGDVVKHSMNIEQKWQLVWSDEHTRWQQAQKAPHLAESAKMAEVEGAPAWYIKKFMDKTITYKQAQGLPVSLRSNDVTFVVPGSVLAAVSDSSRQMVRRVLVQRGHHCSCTCSPMVQSERQVRLLVQHTHGQCLTGDEPFVGGRPTWTSNTRLRRA
jgi:cytokinesis protein